MRCPTKKLCVSGVATERRNRDTSSRRGVERCVKQALGILEDWDFRMPVLRRRWESAPTRFLRALTLAPPETSLARKRAGQELDDP